jgi:hypothetical protein
VVAEDSRLCVCPLEGESHLRWTFKLPSGAELEDFVATGRRIYVATTIGLFCLADDPGKAPPSAGYEFSWEGNPLEPSLAGDESPDRKR